MAVIRGHVRAESYASISTNSGPSIDPYDDLSDDGIQPPPDFGTPKRRAKKYVTSSGGSTGTRTTTARKTSSGERSRSPNAKKDRSQSPNGASTAGTDVSPGTSLLPAISPVRRSHSSPDLGRTAQRKLDTHARDARDARDPFPSVSQPADHRAPPPFEDESSRPQHQQLQQNQAVLQQARTRQPLPYRGAHGHGHGHAAYDEEVAYRDQHAVHSAPLPAAQAQAQAQAQVARDHRQRQVSAPRTMDPRDHVHTYSSRSARGYRHEHVHIHYDHLDQGSDMSDNGGAMMGTHHTPQYAPVSHGSPYSQHPQHSPHSYPSHGQRGHGHPQVPGQPVAGSGAGATGEKTYTEQEYRALHQRLARLEQLVQDTTDPDIGRIMDDGPMRQPYATPYIPGMQQVPSRDGSHHWASRASISHSQRSSVVALQQSAITWADHMRPPRDLFVVQYYDPYEHQHQATHRKKEGCSIL